MFNLAEILTLIIGSLLALVFIDGLRRSLRSRASLLKVDLMDSMESETSDFEQEWLDGYNEKDNSETPKKVIKEISEEPEEIDINQSSNLARQLLIINLSSGNDDVFSCDSISNILINYSFLFDERGYFSVIDEDNHLLFNILNGKNPGTFLEGISTSDIAFVFDPLSVLSPVEVFDLMYEISQIISESFNSELLDENRNMLTKQMLVHMRQEAQEFQRQKLAIVS
jgi:FtsZ-interacting cell division protein ZipA